MRENRRARQRLSRAALLVALSALAATTGALAGQAPKTAGNVAVNAPQAPFPQGAPGRVTSSIASDSSGRDLLVGFMNYDGLCGPPVNFKCPPPSPLGLSGYAFSTDGGKSWTDAGLLPEIGSSITADHPWVDRLTRNTSGADADDRDSGTYFITARMQAQDSTGTGLGIYRGEFGASTFTIHDSRTIDSPDPANNQYSRQAIAAAKDGSAAAYIVLTNIDAICGVAYAGFGQIELWNTQDGGETWHGSTIVSPDGSDILDPNNPNCGASGFLQIAPALTIGTHGEVYAIWQRGPYFSIDGTFATTDAVFFAASFDRGKTFTHPVSIATLNSMRQNPPVGYAKNRMNDQPRIAVAAGGPHRGRIYVTFPSAATGVTSAAIDQTSTSSQVYAVHSDDRGRTWSTPVALAPAVPATGVKRFWPTVGVRPNGDVDVVYEESQEVATGTPCSVVATASANRTGPLSSLVDTFWVQSRDGGATFSTPLRVSSQTSNWCTAPYTYGASNPAIGSLLSNAGDYIGSASIENATVLTFPDDRSGPMDTFFGAVTGTAPRPPHH